ncbi:hypothetical protein [Vibrio phage phiKT1028]|nr:hypothetical protein [Vibrio phage phiKT1028]
MVDTIKGSLAGGGSHTFTMKRDDGGEDVQITSNENGEWSVEIQSDGKRKVNFSFYDKELFLAKHPINFMKRLEVIPTGTKFASEGQNNIFWGRLLDENKKPLQGATVECYIKAGNKPEIKDEYVGETDEDGLVGCNVGLSYTTGEETLTIRMVYGEFEDSLTFYATPNLLIEGLDDPLIPKEVMPGEPIRIIGSGRIGSGYMNETIDEEEAYLAYFTDRPYHITEIKGGISSNSKVDFTLDVHDAVVISNNFTFGVKPNIIEEFLPPKYFRLAPRSMMYNNPNHTTIGGSWEMWGAILNENYETPNYNLGSNTDKGLTMADYDLNRLYRNISVSRDDWKFYAFVNEIYDFNLDKPVGDFLTLSSRGRIINERMRWISTDKETLNLGVGTNNFVHVGNPAKIVTFLCNVDGSVMPNEPISFYNDGTGEFLGTVSTDRYGRASMDFPARDEVGRMIARAEWGELIITANIDWIPLKTKLAKTVTAPFLNPINKRGFHTWFLNGVDQYGGELLPMMEGSCYEGIFAQCFDVPSKRPYTDTNDEISDYKLNFTEDAKLPARTRFGLACDEFYTETEVISDQAEGINPLLYAPGATAAHFDLKTGCRVIDNALTPMVGVEVKVWLDVKEGDAWGTFTTDKYGIVHFTVPYSYDSMTRSAFIESSGYSYELKMVWTKSPTASNVDITLPETATPGAELRWDLISRSQNGQILKSERPSLFTIYAEYYAAMYRKHDHEEIDYYMTRTTDSMMTADSEIEEIDYVIYTEAGYKEFTVNTAGVITRQPNGVVGSLTALPWSQQKFHPSAPFTIGVVAKDADGNPVTDAKVELRKGGVTGEILQTRYTNELGQIEFGLQDYTSQPNGPVTYYFTHGGLSATWEIYQTTDDEPRVTKFEDVDYMDLVVTGDRSVFTAKVKDQADRDKAPGFDRKFYDRNTLEEITDIRTIDINVGYIAVSLSGSGVRDIVYSDETLVYSFRVKWDDVPVRAPADFVLDEMNSEVFLLDQDMVMTGHLVDDQGERIRPNSNLDVEVMNVEDGSDSDYLQIMPDGSFSFTLTPSQIGQITCHWMYLENNLKTTVYPVIENAAIRVLPLTTFYPRYNRPANVCAYVVDQDGNPVKGALITVESFTADIMKGKTDERGLVFVDTPFVTHGDDSPVTHSVMFCDTRVYTDINWLPNGTREAKEVVGLHRVYPQVTKDAKVAVVVTGYDETDRSAATPVLTVFDMNTMETVAEFGAGDGSKQRWIDLGPYPVGKKELYVCMGAGYGKFTTEWIDGIYDPVTEETYLYESGVALLSSGWEDGGRLRAGDLAFTPVDGDMIYVREQGTDNVFSFPINKDSNASFDILLTETVPGTKVYDVYRQPDRVLKTITLKWIESIELSMSPDTYQLALADDYPYIGVYVKDPDGELIGNIRVDMYDADDMENSLQYSTSEAGGPCEFWPDPIEGKPSVTYVFKVGDTTLNHVMTWSDSWDSPLVGYNFDYYAGGDDVPVNKPIRIYGTLEDQNGGIFQGDGSLSIMNQATGIAQRFEGVIDENGKFDFGMPGLPQGKYNFSMFSGHMVDWFRVTTGDFPDVYAATFIETPPTTGNINFYMEVKCQLVDSNGDPIQANGIQIRPRLSGVYVPTVYSDNLGQFTLRWKNTKSGEQTLDICTYSLRLLVDHTFTV